jgi:4-amino-4-deoxy-L-arabinose transferase-like glycosyltransferase
VIAEDVAVNEARATRHAGLLRWLPLLVVAISAAAIVASMRRTSTTFDEIVLIAAGARGYATGHFDMTPDHPPIMQYLYGLPAHLAHVHLPAEAPGRWSADNRYVYSQTVFWGSGNNPERLAFQARLIGALCAVLLALAVWGFTRRRVSAIAAVFAVTLAALLPDVLAHGGVAYNDVPHALFFFCTLWAIDETLRAPALWRGALAGALAAIALGIKFSAVLIAPIALLLIIAEAMSRRSDADRAWLRATVLAVLAALAAMYVATALVYRGDFALAGLRHGIGEQFLHVDRGHNAPAYLLGRTSATGWWYYFPLVFLFKTPAALHLLIIIALAGAVLARRASMRDGAGTLLRSALRMPLLATLLVGAALVTARLDIGFRYALPLLPPVCVLIAAGLARMWEQEQRQLRALIAVLLVWYGAGNLAAYPDYLAYLSEYAAGRDNYMTIADSSLDWGQGLLELRNDLRARGNPRVYLSYFGSAIPEGYGIRYLPLASFGALPPQQLAPGEPEPSEVVISATNLAGIYLPGDPFAHLRDVRPERIIAHTLYVFRLR